MKSKKKTKTEIKSSTPAIEYQKAAEIFQSALQNFKASEKKSVSKEPVKKNG